MSEPARRVAYVTAAPSRSLDEDMLLIVEALVSNGVKVEIVDWDDSGFAWGSVDLALVRATWDYAGRIADFRQWIDTVDQATTLANPASVLRWNLDKRYLAELAAEGAPVVPTIFVEPGGAVDLPDGEVVVKPAISAGSWDTDRYRPEQHDEARRHAERLLAEGRVVMLQPYQHAVDDHGETALVYHLGRYSHGLRKGQILGRDSGMVDGLYAEENMSAREPTADEIAAATRILDLLSSVGPRVAADRLAYARVDLVPGSDGQPLLLELEAVEPSLFNMLVPGSEDALAAAVVSLLAELPAGTGGS